MIATVSYFSIPNYCANGDEKINDVNQEKFDLIEDSCSFRTFCLDYQLLDQKQHRMCLLEDSALCFS